MINNYEIKHANGEEVLYLYFNFDYEFSKDEFKMKKQHIEDSIKEFIKKNKIYFKGATVLLISGGVLFGSINLNTPTFSSISMENPITSEDKIDILENINEKVVEDNNILESVKEEIEDASQQKEDVKEEKTSIANNSVTNNNSNKTINKSFNNEIDNTNVNNSTNTIETTPIQQVESKIEEVVKEEIKEVDNNIYVNVKRSNGTVLKLELEEYIIGVVGAEMPASFNIEALKAQAIIARTYALKANSKGQVLSDNESTQSYKSSDELKNIWGSSYDTYYNKIKSAVESTKGAYLTYNGEYIEAVYHSTSNGKTESSSNVWGNYYPYLVSVESPYDSVNPSFEMSKDISYNELSSKLGFEVNNETSFNILGYTIGDRVDTISILDNIYTGVQFRNILGLRSADFEITKNEFGITIKTRGYGHGVGLSQYGANGMAKNGYSYQEILKHYYSGVSISYL